jgi:NADPH2:quinone reductase
VRSGASEVTAPGKGKSAMRAAWYESQGPAREVLVVGEMPDPTPGPGEVRIRLAASGVNPGDVKMQQDAFGYGMPYPRVVPHSDGAGVIDPVRDGVSASRVGERVWCYGAQSYRPFGTAAEYAVVPTGHAVPLPAGVLSSRGRASASPASPPTAASTPPGRSPGRWSSFRAGPGRSGCAPSNWPAGPAPTRPWRAGRSGVRSL